MAITALIIEDDPDTRRVVERALRDAGIEVVEACGSGERALGVARRTPVDVALVDLGLPGMSGIETIRALRAARPDLTALVLTVNESPTEIVGAIEAGASGYLLKGLPLSTLVTAVEQVKNGLSPISPAIARHLLATIRRQAPPRREFSLTEREHDVLALLVGGHSYADVGTALEIQFGTVQSHVKNIYRKLEVCSKAEAVRVALTEGALKPPSR